MADIDTTTGERSPRGALASQARPRWRVRGGVALCAAILLLVPWVASSQQVTQLFPEIVQHTGMGACAWFTPDRRRVIFVDPGWRERHSRATYDFTIAHETAHHVLGHVDQYDTAHRYGFTRPYGAREMELQADCAAAYYFVRVGRAGEIDEAVRGLRSAMGSGDESHPDFSVRVRRIQECTREASARFASASPRGAESGGRGQTLRGRVGSSSGLDGMREDASCTVTLTRGSQCRARIVCAGTTVYGFGTSGYYDCPRDSDTDDHRDRDTTSSDGDPAFHLDWEENDVIVRDDSSGRYGRFDFVILLSE